MMPKSNKTIKKGFDPPGNNYIALGTRSKDSSVPSFSETQKPNSLNSQNESNNSQSNISISNKTKYPSNNPSTNFGTNSNSNFNLNTSIINKEQSSIDSKNVKDEVVKLLEKDETNEKLIKFIESLVSNLKNSNINQSGSNLKQHSQQNDLNFLMALSYIALTRPDVFLKNLNLVEFIVSNLLMSNKISCYDKTNSITKNKQPQSTRSPSSPSQNFVLIQPVICNILAMVFENEYTWPEIFVTAFVYDSIGERCWVENSLCKDFVENVKTVFKTRPIPYSWENSSSQIASNNSNSSLDIINVKTVEVESILEVTESIIDFTNKKSHICPRYESIRSKIEITLVDLMKKITNGGSKGQALKRAIGQSGISINSTVNAENKNIIKLLQNLCGISELRKMATQRLEILITNPKIDAYVQDLLMSICVNCTEGDHIDKDIISSLIKIKPKPKYQQHFIECIRELLKLNPKNFESFIQLVIRNELMSQNQNCQQGLNQTNKLSHNYFLLQIAFSSDQNIGSRIFAQTFLKIILQKNCDQFLRSIKIILRDTVRNCRQEFDLNIFVNEIESENLIKEYLIDSNECLKSNSINSFFSFAGGLSDFSHPQTKERYLNTISDLIAVVILAAITPQIKEAYLRRSIEAKEILSKYYMTMSQIQCDTVTWLQNIFKILDISPNELIRCLFKILFMVDKPEQCYTIDNWPSESEKSTFFRVVSEIPVLSETLHQVLMITQNLPEHLYMLMLCAEENLLKTAALVQKDIYSIKLINMDNFINALFQICMYKYQDPPNLVVTVLYWKAWQILLLISALDPIDFGIKAWEKYPTLRLLMEMVMTDDYNFPPQCSINDNMTVEKYNSIESAAINLEKTEILEFENKFDAKQGINNKTESNSKLIGQVMKFDPIGPPRRPTSEAIQNIKKLNSEYKLGQLLCKSRNPDFLLMLINGQESKISLPWLASMIETSKECLEILPINIVCELVWNLTSGTEEEVQFKKQWNVEILSNRLKIILTNTNITNVENNLQMKQILEFYLKKLESTKPQIRNSSLKILIKLFQPINNLFDRNTSIALESFQSDADLNNLINNFKQLTGYEDVVRPLLINCFRRIILVETNANHLNTCIYYLLTEILNSFRKNQNEINLSSDEINKTNEIILDLASFFFQRNYYLKNITNNEKNSSIFGELLVKICKIIFKYNEIESQSHLIRQLQIFKRLELNENCYLVIESGKKFYYMNEKLFNFIVFIISLFGSSEMTYLMNEVRILNSNHFSDVLNQFVSSRLLKLNCSQSQVLESYLVKKLIDSYSNNFLFELLYKNYDLGTLSIYYIEKKIDQSIEKEYLFTKNQLTTLNEIEINIIKNHIVKVNTESALINLIDDIISIKDPHVRDTKEFSVRKKCIKLKKKTIQNNQVFDILLIKNKIKDFKNRNLDPKNVRNTGIFNYKNERDCLIKLIRNSKVENLEVNLENFFEFLDNNTSIIQILFDIISTIENKDLNKNKYYLNILISYFFRYDPNIINRVFDKQFKLIFEKRISSLNFSTLLSILMHQANWQNLYECLINIFNNNNFFKFNFHNFSLNQSIVLDFLNSLVNLPTFSKIKEFKSQEPKNYVISFLNLNKDQFSYLVDMVVEEFFCIYIPIANQNDLTDDFKAHLDNRIELFDQILRNQNILLQTLFKSILNRLKLQKKIFSAPPNKGLIDKLKEILNNNSEIDLSNIEIFDFSRNILNKIHTLFLYRLYLNHNKLIYEIINSNKIFCNVHQIFDKPTKLDLITHNLLNCFGEIEVNFSYNLTSSGIIGVAVTGQNKLKPENYEMVLLAKKQEAFMVDANFVCIKLAYSHPFIFIRQLPMMEGMLQGRVGYSFDEFKKRKFDKLFHYIIDILNVLVPFVFHQRYLEHIKSIISHYFDVFLSYCEENRDFIGSLVVKFCEFLERFINIDMESGYFLIRKKYLNIIGVLQKSYPEINSLKFLSSIQAIEIEKTSSSKKSTSTQNFFYLMYPTNFNHVNSLLQKLNMPLWKTKQLEPFVNKLSNRSNYEEVLFVLNELDTVSERQPIILSQFAIYLKNLLEDNDDKIRDYALSLLMRYLRLNPKEAKHFYKSYRECLISNKNKIFNTAIKFFSDFILLSSDKSEILIRDAIKGSQKHNMDISKKLFDSIRLLRLEKYVY